MTKKQRLATILELISQYEIDTQEELTSKLNEKGFEVSQATVSRDICELNIIKVEGFKKKYKYASAKLQLQPVGDNILNLFKQVTTSIACANNLIVIKTLSGNAGSAAMAIDAMHIPQILGTVAGDDTLLIVSKTNNDAEIIVKYLKDL